MVEPTTPGNPVIAPTTPVGPAQHTRPQVSTIFRYRVMEDLRVKTAAHHDEVVRTLLSRF